MTPIWQGFPGSRHYHQIDSFDIQSQRGTILTYSPLVRYYLRIQRSRHHPRRRPLDLAPLRAETTSADSLIVLSEYGCSCRQCERAFHPPTISS
jgi:hypothetical protein